MHKWSSEELTVSIKQIHRGYIPTIKRWWSSCFEWYPFVRAKDKGLTLEMPAPLSLHRGNFPQILVFCFERKACTTFGARDTLMQAWVNVIPLGAADASAEGASKYKLVREFQTIIIIIIIIIIIMITKITITMAIIWWVSIKLMCTKKRKKISD